jgi:glutamate-5-semialdehyde dehydrogenase
MIKKFLQKAKETEKYISLLEDSEKNRILLEMADAILENSQTILDANAKDMKLAHENKLNDVGLDRLMLNQRRIQNMADVLIRMTTYPNPVGNLLETWSTEENLTIKRVSVPIGVVSIIYELRPSMTSDGAALCFKTGNVCVLKGADDTENSNHAIIKVLQEVLVRNKLPKEIISFLFDGSKEGIVELVKEDSYIDAVLTRGGAIFNRYIELHSLVPVIGFDRGLNHIYIDKEAHERKALEVARNSKCLIPNVCNAVETLLVHKDISPTILPKLKEIFEAEQTEMKGCNKTLEHIEIVTVKEEDFNVEYLANTLNIKVVNNIEEALLHIDTYGSGHSEAIITENSETAELFMDRVDAACLYHNASTKFSDGSTFNSGPEVGIATNKLHVRGPLRIDALTTYKYKMYGEGTTKLTWNGYFTPISFFTTLIIGALFLPTLISLLMLPLGYLAYINGIEIMIPLLFSILLSIGLGLVSKFKIEKGHNRVAKWVCKAFYVHNEKIYKLERRFETFPRLSSYLVLKLQGLKQFVSLPSALTKLPKKAFIFFTIINTSIWTTTFSLIGYYLGKI